MIVAGYSGWPPSTLSWRSVALEAEEQLLGDQVVYSKSWTSCSSPACSPTRRRLALACEQTDGLPSGLQISRIGIWLVVHGRQLLLIGHLSMGQLLDYSCFDSWRGCLADHAQIMIDKLVLAGPGILVEQVGEPCVQQALQFLRPDMEASLISQESGCCQLTLLCTLCH